VEKIPVVEGIRRSDFRGLVTSVFHDASVADSRLLAFYERKFADRRWRSGFLRTIRGTMDHVVRPLLPQVRQPTLFVSGQEDRIVDPAVAAEAARLLPAGHFVSVPGCGHAPQMEKPWLINRLVVRFLSSERPTTNPRLTQMLTSGVNSIL
jgi:pimeloyl-ACP methyl ester carboxylesterase